MKINRFEDLECWQSARELVNRVYRVCSVDELKKNFSLSDQIKRAGISIMANIAEGFSRKSNKEFIQFLFISKASAAELQSHLYIALDQQYIDRSSFDGPYSDADKVQRQTSNLIKYLNTTIEGRKPNKRDKPE
jgi:four helix bundle protein